MIGRLRGWWKSKTRTPILLKDYPWGEQLFQTERWLDMYGDYHEIEKMSSRYLNNALPFARHGARGYALRMSVGEVGWYDWNHREFSDLLAGHSPLSRAMEAELMRRER